MKDTDFLDVSAYVRSREKKLLDSGSIDRIADASTTQEALRMLSQNSDYDFTALRRPEDYEEIVKAERARVYRMGVEQSQKCPESVEILACKYDYHNVKVALKAKHLGQKVDTPYVEVTTVAAADIAAQVEKHDIKSNLPAHLSDAIREAGEAFERTGNPQMIDISLDRHMYAYMRSLSDKVGNDFITGYVKAAIDFYNVKTMVRVKDMQKGSSFLSDCLARGGNTDPDFFLANYGKTAGTLALAFVYKSYGQQMKTGIESYEKSGNYSQLERLFDNFLLSYVKNAKRIPFGPEVLFSYLVSKENEFRQIRIIMACKGNGIPGDILKERLRDNYV